MAAEGSYHALREQLRLARAHCNRGDLAASLQAVDNALAIDPACVAALALRDDIKAAGSQPAIPSHASLTSSSAATSSMAAPMISAEGWARFEQRALARRLERRAAAARAAIADHRETDALAALAEIRELDPDYSALPPLEVDLATASRKPTNAAGAWLAAAVTIAAIVLGGTWVATRALSPQLPPLTAVRPPEGRSQPQLASVNEPEAELRVRSEAAEPLSEVSPGSHEVAVPRDDSGGDDSVLRVLQPDATPDVLPIAPVPAGVVLASAPPPSGAPVISTHPFVVPPPAISAPAAAIPNPTPVVDDDELVKLALQKFRAAYSTLDVRMAQSVWPNVDEPALARAFRGLQSQELKFADCQVDVRGATATATCRGSALYVPKVGNREPRLEPRVWSFNLRKGWEGWQIETARAQ